MADNTKVSLADLIKSIQVSNLRIQDTLEKQLEIAEQDKILQVIQSVESIRSESESREILEELKAGLLDTSGSGLNANILELINVIKANNEALINTLIKPDLTEAEMEAQTAENEQTKLLRSIEENTGLKTKKVTDKPIALGGGLTALAIALGAVAGAFLGHLKATMLVLSKIGKFVNNYIPANIKTSIIDMGKGISSAFSKLVSLIKTNLISIGSTIAASISKLIAPFITGITNIFEKIISNKSVSSAIKYVSDIFSKFSKFVTNIGTGITSWSNEVKGAWKAITSVIPALNSGVKSVSSVFGSISKFFTGITSHFSMFTKVFGAVAKFFSKIAVPITIIMGLFRGITETIEGFEKDGILGGIAGFIKGFINSVVMSFFDLIKDIVSWIAGALGFDNVEKWLDSWSFEDLWTNFVDWVFSGIKSLFNGIKKLFGFGGDAENKVTEIGKQKKTIKEPKTDSYEIAGKPVIASEPLTKDQMVVMKMSKASGNSYPDWIEQKYQKQNAEPVTAQPKTADVIYKKSSENEIIKQTPIEKPASIVNAPTQVNNSQTQNTMFRSQVRNQDNTLNNYLKWKYL